VDPLLSTGIPLTLLGIERLARVLEEGRLDDSTDARLSQYSVVTLAEADRVARFIGACYASFSQSFSSFTSLSMFYFVAASFSEMARRLGKSDLAGRFFGGDHPKFSEGLNRCVERLLGGEMNSSDARFESEVSEFVAELNIAGLCDASKRNWYPVNFEDVVAGSHKLGLAQDDVRRAIASASWAQQPMAPLKASSR
jgi:FADH2 O2-dependent halogenase